MKYWLSHLPLEVWVDIFCYPWISREELGQIVDRFRNRKYAEYLQFYLHDWGKQKLVNWLGFDKNGFYKYVNYAQHRLHFPVAPMPGNIKSFERISISHFDAQTMNFLRQIGVPTFALPTFAPPTFAPPTFAPQARNDICAPTFALPTFAPRHLRPRHLRPRHLRPKPETTFAPRLLRQLLKDNKN